MMAQVDGILLYNLTKKSSVLVLRFATNTEVAFKKLAEDESMRNCCPL